MVGLERVGGGVFSFWRVEARVVSLGGVRCIVLVFAIVPRWLD